MEVLNSATAHRFGNTKLTPPQRKAASPPPATDWYDEQREEAKRIARESTKPDPYASSFLNRLTDPADIATVTQDMASGPERGVFDGSVQEFVDGTRFGTSWHAPHRMGDRIVDVCIY